MGIDVGQADVDLGNAVGIFRGFGLFQQRRALGVGGQHDLDQGFGSARRFLRHPADTGVAGIADIAIVGAELAGNETQQCGLAGAVAADEANFVASGNGSRRLFEQGTAFHAEREFVDM
jgi:hypothetical protein